MLTKAEQTPSTPKNFTFEWNGGFSYLTYLKKRTTATLEGEKLLLTRQNLILGAFPLQPSTQDIPLTHINSIAVGSKVNWFDLVFAILFVFVTLITMNFLPLLLTALFLWCTFNTNIQIRQRSGNNLNILTSSKDDANSFIQVLANTINQVKHSDNTETGQSSIVPQVLSNKPKKIFSIVSAGIVAILILLLVISSRGGFDNPYVTWVKDATVPGGTHHTMDEALSNDKYFSNVVWKQVNKDSYEEDVNKYVMYQATYTDQSVSINIQAVFQVFSKNQFTPVAYAIDGVGQELSDWTYFLVEVTSKLDGSPTSSDKGAWQEGASTSSTSTSPQSEPPTQTNVEAKSSEQEPAPPVQVATTPVKEAQTPAPASDAVPTVSLKDFNHWTPPAADLTYPVHLDGDNMDIVLGLDHPNGVKVQVVDHALGQGWNISLPSIEGSSPFDEFGNLLPGYSLAVKEHDFTQDGTPEIVLVASDGQADMYVWILTYNFMASEQGTNPLELLWSGIGQSDILMSGNHFLLPYGSQGLYEEYKYANGVFVKN
ncbi:hypothetical protein MF625_001173 [Paenibacillus polymyxa]|uniref:hypothetical protein n=1 Tax=Paenibacillus polymyxa TaxID=1406 RepID=UPI002024BCBA|nr:hypothetical protein [Paenibacillus polymyxa]URJ36731.3 hypothetical protein MF625_001173 [Paenibacillus polymyxa]